MGLKNSLRDLVTAVGGDPTNCNTHESLIQAAATALNPMAALTLDADISDDTDLLGKTASNLQTGIHIHDNIIYGTLKYVTDYAGFSGDESEQSGYYLAIHAEVPEGNGVTIKAITSKEVTLDADGLLVLLVKNPLTKSIKFEATDGTNTFSRTYKLSGLTLAKA